MPDRGDDGAGAVGGGRAAARPQIEPPRYGVAAPVGGSVKMTLGGRRAFCVPKNSQGPTTDSTDHRSRLPQSRLSAQNDQALTTAPVPKRDTGFASLRTIGFLATASS